jgi:hypothetical protein
MKLAVGKTFCLPTTTIQFVALLWVRFGPDRTVDSVRKFQVVVVTRPMDSQFFIALDEDIQEHLKHYYGLGLTDIRVGEALHTRTY